MKNLKDSRHHRRFVVDALDIRGSARAAGEAVINDISITGVSIKTDRKLHLGGRYTLKVPHKGKDIPLEGTVIWCLENDAGESMDECSPLKYAAGLHFANLSQEAVSGLTGFIEFHRVNKITPSQVHYLGGRRDNVRFQMGGCEKTTIVISEPCRVKMLSLGGMLMESDRLYNPGSELQMEMTLPEDVRISFIGKVISYFPPQERPAGPYDIGIKFMTLSEQHRTKLKGLIRWLYLKAATGAGRSIPRHPLEAV